MPRLAELELGALGSWVNSMSYLAHWDHEAKRVRSAGFRACGLGRLSSRPFLVHRTRKSGKPAGWKACATSRFMESHHANSGAHWDHEPRAWNADLQVGAFGACHASPSWSSARSVHG